MKKIEADLIFFDVDGTLVDSRQDIVNSVNQTLDTFGLPHRGFEEIVSFIGNGITNLITRSLGPGNEKLLDKAKDVFEVIYDKNITGSSVLYPGVIEILESYKHKKLYVITNRQKHQAHITLKHLKIDSYFSDIFGGDEQHCLKPSPCSINRILEKTGTDKDKTIIVGDMDVDILAGRNAGIWTCAVTYGLGKKDELLVTQPDYMLDDILKLKQIIE